MSISISCGKKRTTWSASIFLQFQQNIAREMGFNLYEIEGWLQYAKFSAKRESIKRNITAEEYMKKVYELTMDTNAKSLDALPISPSMKSFFEMKNRIPYKHSLQISVELSSIVEEMLTKNKYAIFKLLRDDIDNFMDVLKESDKLKKDVIFRA